MSKLRNITQEEEKKLIEQDSDIGTVKEYKLSLVRPLKAKDPPSLVALEVAFRRCKYGGVFTS